MSWAAKKYVIKSGDLSKLKNAIKRVLSEEQLSKEKPLILKELHGD